MIRVAMNKGNQVESESIKSYVNSSQGGYSVRKRAQCSDPSKKCVGGSERGSHHKKGVHNLEGLSIPKDLTRYETYIPPSGGGGKL